MTEFVFIILFILLIFKHICILYHITFVPRQILINKIGTTKFI